MMTAPSTLLPESPVSGTPLLFTNEATEVLPATIVPFAPLELTRYPS